MNRPVNAGEGDSGQPLKWIGRHNWRIGFEIVILS